MPVMPAVLNFPQLEGKVVDLVKDGPVGHFGLLQVLLEFGKLQLLVALLLRCQFLAMVDFALEYCDLLRVVDLVRLHLVPVSLSC